MEKEKSLVVHGNKVTESIFKYNEFELNLFIALIFKLKGNSEVVEYTAAEIKKLTMLKNRDFKSFEKLLLGMQGKNILLKTDRGYDSIIPFTTLKFDLENRNITVKINSDIQPMLLNLKKEFTKYLLQEFLSLENRYSKRLFQILKQWESVKKKEFDVQYLKKILDAENYDRFERFETRVIKNALEDIHNHTTLKVSYEKVKTGRSISKIIFYINYEKASEQNNIATQNDIGTRKIFVAKYLKTIGVAAIKDLTENQKKLLNVGLTGRGYRLVK